MHDSFFGNASLVSNSFEVALADGVPLRGSILTGYDSDLDFKVDYLAVGKSRLSAEVVSKTCLSRLSRIPYGYISHGNSLKFLHCMHLPTNPRLYL